MGKLKWKNTWVPPKKIRWRCANCADLQHAGYKTHVTQRTSKRASAAHYELSDYEPSDTDSCTLVLASTKRRRLAAVDHGKCTFSQVLLPLCGLVLGFFIVRRCFRKAKPAQRALEYDLESQM